MLIPLWLQKFLLNVLLKKVFGPNRLQIEADIDPLNGAVKAFKAVVAKPIIPDIPSLIIKQKEEKSLDAVEELPKIKSTGVIKSAVVSKAKQ